MGLFIMNTPIQSLFLTQVPFLAMPLGQVPILEFNGVVISQSIAIARFLAKEFGLAGKTNLEQAQADMIVDASSDLQDGKRF